MLGLKHEDEAGSDFDGGDGVPVVLRCSRDGGEFLRGITYTDIGTPG